MKMNIITFDLGQPSAGHKSLFQQRIANKIWSYLKKKKKKQNSNQQQPRIRFKKHQQENE